MDYQIAAMVPALFSGFWTEQAEVYRLQESCIQLQPPEWTKKGSTKAGALILRVHTDS